MECSEMNRREFIKKSGSGLLAAGITAPSVVLGAIRGEHATKIIRRVLGRTGLQVPVVSMGVMNSDSPDLLRKALDMGITLFDTANSYLRGNSETVIGKILEERACRSRVFVATKTYLPRDREKKTFVMEGNTDAFLEKEFNEKLSTSLKRLRTDYVDILYLHSCEGPQMPAYGPVMKLFVKARDSGKARFIGITTHTNEPETIRAAADAGVWDVILTTYNFLQHHREEVKKSIQYAADKGLGVIAMKTQGGARLAPEKKGEINHAAALKWALSDNNVCTAIPGVTTFEQLDLDFGVMERLSLSDEERRTLKVSSLVRDSLYCQQCGSCIGSCAARVEVPTLMRAYMYAEGYGNLLHAGLTLDEIPRNHGLGRCQQCPACSAVCRFGMDIGQRLKALTAMGLADSMNT